MTTCTLPWPLRELSPNVRQHWATLARARRRYRAACYLTAREQGVKLMVAVGPVAVHLRFVPPTRARRDLDNLIAAMKSGLDGLADALGVDDSRFRLSAELAEGEVGGMVQVSVRAAP